MTWATSLHHDSQYHLHFQLQVPIPVASQTWASLKCHNKSKRELLSPKLATSVFPRPLGCSSHWASPPASGPQLPDDPACCLRQAPPLRDLIQSLSLHHTPGSLDLSPEWMHILHQGLLLRWGVWDTLSSRSLRRFSAMHQQLDGSRCALHIYGAQQPTLGDPDPDLLT